MTFSQRIQREHYSHKMLISFFLIALVFLLVQTLAGMKDINDTWILEGLVPAFFIFTILYVLIVSLSHDLRLTSILTSAYVGILNLIPQLKYDFVYGYFDPLPHYGFIDELTRIGRVPSFGTYGVQYGATPGSHLLIAQLSVITGSGTLIAMKAFLSVSPFLIPLVLYLVLRRLEFPAILSKTIIVSSVLTVPLLYRFIGTVGVFPLYVFFTSFWILFMFRKFNSRSGFVLTSLLGIGLVITHDVTAFFMILFIGSVLALSFIRKQTNADTNSSSRMFYFFGAFLLIDVAHLVLSSTTNLLTILDLIGNSLQSIFFGRTPGAISYYSGFYTLNFEQQLITLAIRTGRDAISILFLILAPFAFFRLRLDKRLKTFYAAIVVPALICLAAFVFTFFIRSYVINRALIYLSVFVPFFAGLTLYWAIYSRHYRFQNSVFAVIIFCLLSISILQLYPCQPLVPKVSTDSGSYYVMDLRAFTTVYDRSMIRFVSQNDVNLTLATDSIIRSQIYALTEPSFQTLLTSDDLGSSSIRARLILASFDENTHILVSGRDANGYAQLVSNATQYYGVIYSNSKSYVLLNLRNP